MLKWEPILQNRDQNLILQLCEGQRFQFRVRGRIANKLNMAANPLGYPPKTANFSLMQRTAGYIHEKYRTDGKSDIDPNNAGHVAAIVARSQPVAGVGAFQQGPAPRSAAAKALLDASIANRGMVGERTGIYDENYRGPGNIAVFNRAVAVGRMNAAVIRAEMASNNLSFVRQLGWVSDPERISACRPTLAHHLQDRSTFPEARVDAL